MNLQDLANFVQDMQDTIVKYNDLAVKMDDLTKKLAETVKDPRKASLVENIITQALILMARTPKIPYKFGGESVDGMDCSGFVQTVFLLNGILLPRTSEKQGRTGQTVLLMDIQPGDLIAFDRKIDGIYDHIGISLGGDLMIHTAGNPEGINIADWRTRYKDVPFDIRRVI